MPILDRLPVAHPWYAIDPEAHGVIRIWEPHVDRLLRANLFFVQGRDRHLVVDAGMGVVPLRPFLAPLLDRPVAMVLTHTHVDHVGAVAEFADDLMVHPSEAGLLSDPAQGWSIDYDRYPAGLRQRLKAAGFDVSGLALTALPHAGYDPGAWHIPAVSPTRLIDEGDRIDLGDRIFAVLHTPGHTPGGICLYEEATGVLIAGDTVYDGILIDSLPESDPAAYRRSLLRLLELEVTDVHGGHRDSFDGPTLRKIVRAHLAGE